jgi:hypothetical protein
MSHRPDHVHLRIACRRRYSSRTCRHPCGSLPAKRSATPWPPRPPSHQSMLSPGSCPSPQHLQRTLPIPLREPSKASKPNHPTHKEKLSLRASKQCGNGTSSFGPREPTAGQASLPGKVSRRPFRIRREPAIPHGPGPSPGNLATSKPPTDVPILRIVPLANQLERPPGPVTI